MTDGIFAALITGVLSLVGVLATLASRRSGQSERAQLEAKLEAANAQVTELEADIVRYKSAYMGLLELTQGLLEASETSSVRTGRS